MHSLKSVLVLVVAASVAAQTPPDAPSFIPATQNHLNVTFPFPGLSDFPAGTFIPLGPETAGAPSVAPATELNGTFTLIMVDPDAVNPNGTARTVLHWLQTDLVANGLTFLNNTAPIAPYRSPAPPPEIPTRSHRYTQLLFTQTGPVVIPSSFAAVVPGMRTPFDLTGFLAGNPGIGSVVAASFFLTRNDSLVMAANGTNGTTGATPVTAGANSLSVGLMTTVLGAFVAVLLS